MTQALDPAHSVTLLASAGTGKTWTLTARIVRLLLAGAAPGGILALTFTRKAAAEMRARVASRLQTLAFADEAQLGALLSEIGADDTTETRQRARELFEAYTYAETPLRASTLHVFCAEVLSRFALEAEVPAGFTLIENERALRGEAIESVLRQAHRDGTGTLAQALDTLAHEGFSEFDVRSVLQTFFEHRAELWAAAEGQAEPLAALCEQLANALPYSADEDMYGATDAPALTAKLSMLLRMLAEQGDVGLVKAKKLAPAIASTGAARYAALADALLRGDGEPYAFKPAKTKYTPPQAETVSANFREVSEATVRVRQAILRAATYQRSSAALTLGVAALDAFAQSLHRSHQLGFAELEWQTVRLLKREGSADWVRYKLDQKLEHVLLDEFQDTSPTQWCLLLPLLQEFALRNDGARTVFLVGDGKQSIYGFRRAEPALLGIAGDWLRKQLGAITESLDQSRRSAPAIIQFVNALFADEAGARIAFTPHRTALSALHGSVEIAPLILADEKPKAANDALRNPLTTPREIGEDRRAAEEAHWVVDRITQLIDVATPVTERDGSTRAMHFGDVMVLARHRTHLGVLEKALGANGIPYSSATRGTLLDTAIAQDLLALLAALDSPHRDLDLAHALRSPLFSVGDPELLWLATAARAASQSWFAALATADAPAGSQRAHRLLTQWRILAQGLPPHDLIDRIVSEGDLLRRCAAARPHDTLLSANLSALLQLALDSDHGRHPTLGGFLRHCAALHEGQGPDEAPPPSSEARVRVMTIHAAKGLEAPAVFLVNSAPSSRPAHAGWRVDWPAEAERPQVIVHVGKAEQREVLSLQLIAAEKEREDREALNLLYVAVTRAQQYLFVSGFQSGKSVQAESWHARCRDALDSLLPEPGEAPMIWRHAEGSVPAITEAVAPRIAATSLDQRLLQPLPSARAAPPITAVTRDPAAALRGQVIHAALQGLSSATAIHDDALRARVQQQLGLQLPDALWRDALSEARRVHEAPALARFFAPEHKAWDEVALHIETDEGTQVNVLDRLVDTGDALWVLDYKTHRAKDSAAVLAAASEQLQRYVAAVQKLFPKRAVRAAVIWTPEALLIEHL